MNNKKERVLIKMSPVIHEFNNCFQGQIESIVEQIFHRNYLLSQIHRWRNTFELGEDGLVDKSKEEYFEEKDLEMIGLKAVQFNFQSIEEVIEAIIKELEGGEPVIAGIQISNCPWDVNYRSGFVLEHMLVVNGYDYEKKAFLCCDTMYAKENEELPIEEFIAGGSLKYFKIQDLGNSQTLMNEEELIKQQVKEMLNEGEDFERYRRTAQFFYNCDQIIINKEKYMDNILFSGTYMMLRDLARTRQMFSYIYTNDEKLKDESLAKIFNMLKKKWIYVRILYVRASTTDDQKECFHSMGEYIEEIATIEENVARYMLEGDSKYIEEFLELCDEESCEEQEEWRNVQVKQVDISQYYNNKAFGVLADTETASYSKLGEYIIRPDGTINVKLPNGTKMELSVPEDMDNILCDNQNIPINMSKVKGFFLIGNTEYAAETDELIIDYLSGEKQIVKWELPEWYTEILEDEILVYKNDAIQKEENGNKVTSFDGKLFMKFIPAKKAGMIKSILLPEEGRNHLFYMLVCVEE